MSELNRYLVGDLAWRTATESTLHQKSKFLSLLFVILVSFLETEEVVSGEGLFFPINDELSQRIAALINVGIVGDGSIDCGQK